MTMTRRVKPWTKLPSISRFIMIADSISRWATRLGPRGIIARMGMVRPVRTRTVPLEANPTEESCSSCRH